MASTFSERVLSVTQDKLLPKVVDTILNSNVLARRILSNPKKWSGEQLKVPIKYQKNTTGGSFSGFDTFDTNASETRTRMAFDPKFYQKTCALPLSELAVNATESKVLDLMATELESTAQDAADDIGTIFYSDGTGNGGKDFLGLGALVDDGTNVASIGGLARSTYTTLQGTVTDSGGTLTLVKMSTLWNNVTSGSQKPTIGITDETVFSLYEKLVQPFMRYVDVPMDKAITGNAGFGALRFKGMPIISDEKCTSGYLYFLNEDYLEWRGLTMPETQPIRYAAGNIEGNDYGNAIRNLGFSWSGWIKPTNAAAVIGHIYLGGEFITRNPKRHGVLTGITGA